MPFCTSCGSQMANEARFCPSCGQAVQAVPAAAAVEVVEPLEYTIHGTNLQAVAIKLKPGQELYAEAGKMLYKTPSVEWETRMSGKSLTDKIWGAVKRKLMGESLFMTYFRAWSPGEVAFAGDYPGRIQVMDLPAGKSVLVQRDSFLAAQSSVQLNIALMKKLGAGFFGGEGFILQKLTGPGVAFVHGGGDFIEFQLGPGEVLQVDTGCIVAFDETVNYDIQFVGNIKTAIFGGEGIFLATLTGPGKVVVQSMTLEKLRRQMMPAHTGGDERGPLGALGGIFSSED